MSRFARHRRVFFFEEPLYGEFGPRLREEVCPKTGVHVITPILRSGTARFEANAQTRQLLGEFISQNGIERFISWYYTPMAMEFTTALNPRLTVYDCMDELSAFAGAPEQMRINEQAVFQVADLVFTGGASLFESKRKQHASVHLFPSSVDKEHFSTARLGLRDPDDQKSLPQPRLGYAGVIDERMNLQLVNEVAMARPEWQFIFLGPVVKIDPAALPKAANIHWLGPKAYADLPAYFSGWQIGILPFALNESTRFISPTKTPEYLSAGLRVISTPIRDVVSPYGALELVSIAENTSQFLAAAEALLDQPDPSPWRKAVDEFLSQMSWDRTWSGMEEIITRALMPADRLAANRAFFDQGNIATESVQNV